MGIYDMGKDIDRNITRQLWEKNKNSFTRNDVIPVENGGTGENNLELFYPKLVKDKNIERISVIDAQLLEGFKAESDCTAVIFLNNKSFYIEGRMHISRNKTKSSNQYLKIKLNNGGYDIHSIVFGPVYSRFSIINDTLIFDGFFDSANSYDVIFNGLLVPFI